MRRFLLRKDPAYGTLRPEEWFDRPHFRIRVMGPEYMLAAAERKARALGLNATIMASSLNSLEARIVGETMAHVAREIEAHDRPMAAPAVFLLGGELVVTTGKNGGLGGRNQEFVAGAALHIADSRRIVLAPPTRTAATAPPTMPAGIVDGEGAAPRRRGGPRRGRGAAPPQHLRAAQGDRGRHRHGDTEHQRAGPARGVRGRERLTSSGGAGGVPRSAIDGFRRAVLSYR